VTTTLNPSHVPAILYRLDPMSGAATKVVDLIGSSQVMGLAFGDDGKLYGTDFMSDAGLVSKRCSRPSKSSQFCLCESGLP
jgi:hypothetical protein